MNRTGISSYTVQQLADLVTGMGQPAFRAKQLFNWLHEKRRAGFSAMTNLPKGVLAALEQRCTIETLEPARRQHSKDGTVKYLFRLADGNSIETVLMRYSYGNTVCVSTQVGCRMGCRFCASTQGGRVRNLTAGEIANEVYAAARDTGERVSHIVLMGIGEPLDNFDHVMDFLSIISSPNGVNIGMRNISLSTCGLVPMIYKLAERHLGLTLSVSLHAPTDEMRSSMMPVNDVYPVEQLIRACRDYQQETGRRVSFEYSMVNGVNDSPQTARRLAQAHQGHGCAREPYSHQSRGRLAVFRYGCRQRQTFSNAPDGAGRQRHRAPPPGHRHQRRLRPAAPRGKRRNDRMKLVAKTDIGSQRSENQDSYRGGRRPDDAVWGAVCDGMGGARGGRLASTMAVDALQQAIEAGIDEAHTPQAGRALLESAVEQANRSVYEKARGTPSLSGMGTTVVCALVRGGLAQYVHVGDSRIYLFRNNKLLQLTKDHSMVQEMVEQGALTEEEAQNHPAQEPHHPRFGRGTAGGDGGFRRKRSFAPATSWCCAGRAEQTTSRWPRSKETPEHAPSTRWRTRWCRRALKGGGLDNVTVLLMQVEAAEENNG